jgi:hypothetical protein
MRQYRAALAALDHELNRINRTIGQIEQGELRVSLREDEHAPVMREELILALSHLLEVRSYLSMRRPMSRSPGGDVLELDNTGPDQI